MTYAFVQDVPIDAGVYEQIIDGLGDEPPKGLVVHIAMERPEGGLWYVDVWESEADWDRFAEERLHPVVFPVLCDRFGGESIPPEPDRVLQSVIHVWGRER